MLLKLWNYLQGKKTYLVAVAMFLYAVSGFYLHQLSLTQAIDFLFGSGTLVSLRSALNKLS